MLNTPSETSRASVAKGGLHRTKIMKMHHLFNVNLSNFTMVITRAYKTCTTRQVITPSGIGLKYDFHLGSLEDQCLTYHLVHWNEPRI